MEATRFDRFAKLFADRRLTRRQALATGGAGLTAATFAATGLGPARSTAAQDATPTAAGETTMFLFVQSFQSGSIAPKDGEDGTFTLTLAQGLGQTIYFSDRPERIVGAAPTPTFLERLGFEPDNPPNAALVVETASGDTEIAVLELTNPTYETLSHTATYDVQVLAEWEDELGVGLTETPADLAAFGERFGAAHLFIDDCADHSNLPCWFYDGQHSYQVGQLDGTYGFCWKPGCLQCVPCGGGCEWGIAACNEKYPDLCHPPSHGTGGSHGSCSVCVPHCPS